MLTFNEYQRRWPLLPSQALMEMFYGLPEREQDEAWAHEAERAALRIEAELLIDRQLEEPWCPECHDRRRDHEPGDCAKYIGAENSTPTSTSTGTEAVELPADDPLKSIPARVYLEAVAGVEVSSSGRCRCPMPDHPDVHPSAKAYGTRWQCFSCGAKGTIIDLGGALYGLEASGRGYHEIRQRLLADLGLGMPV